MRPHSNAGFVGAGSSPGSASHPPIAMRSETIARHWRTPQSINAAKHMS